MRGTHVECTNLCWFDGGLKPHSSSGGLPLSVTPTPTLCLHHTHPIASKARPNSWEQCWRNAVTLKLNFTPILQKGCWSRIVTLRSHIFFDVNNGSWNGSTISLVSLFYSEISPLFGSIVRLRLGKYLQIGKFYIWRTHCWSFLGFNLEFKDIVWQYHQPSYLSFSLAISSTHTVSLSLSLSLSIHTDIQSLSVRGRILKKCTNRFNKINNEISFLVSRGGLSR